MRRELNASSRISSCNVLDETPLAREEIRVVLVSQSHETETRATELMWASQTPPHGELNEKPLKGGPLAYTIVDLNVPNAQHAIRVLFS